jgi:hypothetical protein
MVYISMTGDKKYVYLDPETFEPPHATHDTSHQKQSRADLKL